MAVFGPQATKLCICGLKEQEKLMWNGLRKNFHRDGLLYDDESLDAAYNMIQNWTEAERFMLRKEVPRTGLMMPFRDELLHHVAQDMFKLSKAGLERRGYKEVRFLNDVSNIVKDGYQYLLFLAATLKKIWRHFRC